MPKKLIKRRGRPSGDHSKRQREIADILLKVIGSHGFDKASLRMVAREAKCTTGVLSHYFSNKEDLIFIAVDLLFDWAEQRAMDAAKRTDSLKALQLAVGVAEETAQPPFDFWAVWLQVLAKAKQNRRLAHVVRRRHGRYRDIMTEIVKDGQARKQIRSDIDAEVLADHFNAVSDGIGLMGPIETTRLTKKRVEQLTSFSMSML